MKPVHVNSSTISALRYNDASEVLRVWFTSGAVYDYYKVPPEEYENLLHATSIGAHYNEFIKNLFDYRKIRD
jgi:lysyl-tRNA synthetase, class II